MKFKELLLQGTLIKRYKRFFVDIKVNNSIITAHCPNTGSMMGLLDQGNKVWVTKNDDPKRKLKFTLEMIEVNKKNMDEAIEQSDMGILKSLIRSEVATILRDIWLKRSSWKK